MSYVNKSKNNLKILVNDLSNLSNIYTKELKNRIKMNLLLNTFENKASNDLKLIINQSSKGKFLSKINMNKNQSVDNLITSRISDKFYTELNYNEEKKELKNKINKNLYLSIQNTLNKIKEENHDPDYFLYLKHKNLNNIKPELNLKKARKVLLDNSSYLKEILEKDEKLLAQTIDDYGTNIKSIMQNINKPSDSNKIIQRNQNMQNTQNTLNEKDSKISIRLPKLKALEYIQFKPFTSNKLESNFNTININKISFNNVKNYSSRLNNNQKPIKIESQKEISINHKDPMKFLTETSTRMNEINNFSPKLNKSKSKNTVDTVLYSYHKLVDMRNNSEQKLNALDNLIGTGIKANQNIIQNSLTKKRLQIKKQRQNKNKLISLHQKLMYLNNDEISNFKINKQLDVLDNFSKKLKV